MRHAPCLNPTAPVPEIKVVSRIISAITIPFLVLRGANGTRDWRQRMTILESNAAFQLYNSGLHLQRYCQTSFLACTIIKVSIMAKQISVEIGKRWRQSRPFWTPGDGFSAEKPSNPISVLCLS